MIWPIFLNRISKYDFAVLYNLLTACNHHFTNSKQIFTSILLTLSKCLLPFEFFVNNAVAQSPPAVACACSSNQKQKIIHL